MPNTIKQQLEWASQVLYSISCSASLDSEILLAFCLKKNRSYLMTWPEQELDEDQLKCFHDLVHRRLQPQPIAYLTGTREFYSMALDTTPATLVPRPETEMLVDKVLELIADRPSANILELGTGTGAIALAIKQHAPHSQIVATDVSQQALDVARGNALQHQLDVEFLLSDWYQFIPAQSSYDIIVSNPPYIAADDPYLGQGDLPAEPQQALSSGETGLEALQVIIRKAGEFLNNNGWIVLEHGYDQAQQVHVLLSQGGFKRISLVRDINDLARLTMAQFSPAEGN